MSDKKNAKKELLDNIKNYDVIAAEITFGDECTNLNSFKLKPLYTNDDWSKFMIFLNREYNSGFGGQYLFGTIFCKNGIWLTRGEYDGSEWWKTHNYPNLREFFDETDVIKYERSTKIQNIEKQD